MKNKQQSPEVTALAQKILKSEGKQCPVTLMRALLLFMQLVDAVTHGIREK